MEPSLKSAAFVGERKLTPRIGSELVVDKEVLLGGAVSANVRLILQERGVVCFRRLGLTDEEQVRFARTIGNVEDEGENFVFDVSLDPRQNPEAAEYLKSSVFWHFDGSSVDVPNFGCLLSARRLASSGGSTEFCNTYAAYEDLPPSNQAHCETLRVVHSIESMQRLVTSWPTYSQLVKWQAFEEKTHPLVWTHESVRKSLVIGASASHVEGMGIAEGRALLCRLAEWATQPRYVYRHDWQLGDLIIWDNTGTMHRVMPYSADSGRLMKRTKLRGEEHLGIADKGHIQFNCSEAWQPA